MSRVPVPGNRAPWGRLNPGPARTKRATGGLGGGFWKRNAKVYRGWVPCNQDSGTQAGHGRWAVGSGRWRGSSSAQPQPWALTPPVSRKSREFIGVAVPQTHGQTRHRPRRLDSTRPSLPRVAVSPVVLTAPLQQTNNSAHRLHPPVPAYGLILDGPLVLIGHRRRWPRNMGSVCHFCRSRARPTFWVLQFPWGSGIPPRLGPATRVFLAAPK